jgi:hypothetical protein
MLSVNDISLHYKEVYEVLDTKLKKLVDTITAVRDYKINKDIDRGKGIIYSLRINMIDNCLDAKILEKINTDIWTVG